MAKRIRAHATGRRPHFIRAWRVYRSLTQEQLAERLGMTAATLSRIERGLLPYTQDNLEFMADILQCTPADLLSRDPSDGENPEQLWGDLKPPQRRQAVEVIKALKRAEEGGGSI